MHPRDAPHQQFVGRRRAYLIAAYNMRPTNCGLRAEPIKLRRRAHVAHIKLVRHVHPATSRSMPMRPGPRGNCRKCHGRGGLQEYESCVPFVCAVVVQISHYQRHQKRSVPAHCGCECGAART